MEKEKVSKVDQLIEIAKKTVAYVDTKELIIGVYCDTDDMIAANKNKAVKKLKVSYGYRIQMVIK